jgi:hypothetical protein
MSVIAVLQQAMKASGRIILGSILPCIRRNVGTLLWCLISLGPSKKSSISRLVWVGARRGIGRKFSFRPGEGGLEGAVDGGVGLKLLILPVVLCEGAEAIEPVDSYLQWGMRSGRKKRSEQRKAGVATDKQELEKIKGNVRRKRA